MQYLRYLQLRLARLSRERFLTANNQIEAWREEVARWQKPGMCPHNSNLLHQLRPGYARSARVRHALTFIVPAYLDFVDTLDNMPFPDGQPDANDATLALERYLEVLRQPNANCFDSVADFLTKQARLGEN